MAAQPPPRAVLRGTSQMSLNERFTTLLKNTGPRPANIGPSGWRRPPRARDLGRRARHLDYTPRVREAGHLGKAPARRRAPLGSPEGAFARAAIAGGRDLLFMHGDSALEGARGANAPRTVLQGGMWPRGQDPLPAGLASAPQRNFRRGAPPARGGPHRGGLARGAQGRLRSPAQRLERKGPHRRARWGAQGQGRSPLIRPRLTKEQLDAELDAYMALPKAKERLDADFQADMAQALSPDEGLDADLPADMAQAVSPDEDLDSDLDAYMAPALPDEEGLDADLDVCMADPDPDTTPREH